MFDDPLSEDELHDWWSSALLDALKYGTRDEVITCLKKLDRLDRELLEIVVQQLEGSKSVRREFRNRFQLASPRGRPPSIAAEPLIRDGIRRFYRQCREKGLSSKVAVFETEKNYSVRRALIMKIISEGKDSE
jgi:hypothetical protein